MSASLVGSEMCIRDSYPERDPAGRGEDRETVNPPPVLGDHIGPCLAVSYTHLTLPTICSV
eukprot:6435914-Alexandrium_andersonii.AAC.1